MFPAKLSQANSHGVYIGPKAETDGPFIAVEVAGEWYWKCRKTHRFATIVGTKVIMHGAEPKRLV
jgi:hypothetical protein